MTVIHIGDGRHIELDEGAIFRPPQIPPPKRGRSREISPRFQDKRKRIWKEREGDNHPVRRLMETKEGYREWWSYKNIIYGRYSDRGAKHGEGAGKRRKRMGYLMGWVKRKVKKDMENIQKVHPDLDEMAKEALEGALGVLRGPNSQQVKLSAAKLLLEFTKSKPVAKSEVSVNAAESWLASLGKEESDS